MQRCQVDRNEWRRTIDRDLNGFFYVVEAALPHLRRGDGGTIVAMTSAAIARHAPKDILSIAPKAAIEALVRGIAREEGFGWLRRNVPPNEAPARVIHGDFGLNNVLFEDGRVSAVLDWETLQIGDPNYEVAYLRDPLTSRAALWEPFLDAYRAEGGRTDAASLRFHRAARWLRNVAFSNVSAGRFDTGAWDSLPVAALAVAVRPVFMQRADDFARDPQVEKTP